MDRLNIKVVRAFEHYDNDTTWAKGKGMSKELKTPVDQVIWSLSNEPELWAQNQHTLDHKEGISIWTANVPYLNCGIYRPSRKTSFLEGVRLQLAVNRWYKYPIILNNHGRA